MVEDAGSFLQARCPGGWTAVGLITPPLLTTSCFASSGALCSSESTQPGTSITETVLLEAADASKNSPHLFRLWEGKGSECPQRLQEWRGQGRATVLGRPTPHPTALQPGPGRGTQGCHVLKEPALFALCIRVRERPAQLRDPDTALGKGLACLWGDCPFWFEPPGT